MTQWVNPPGAGASGSCTISARDFASVGTSAICRVGLWFWPSQVYWDGIWVFSSNAVLEIFIAVAVKEIEGWVC